MFILNKEKNFKVELKPIKQDCEYIFYQDDTKLKILNSKIPIALTERMPIWNHIISYIDYDEDYTKKKRNKIMNDTIIPGLQEYYNTIVQKQYKQEAKDQRQSKQQIKNRIKNGKILYDKLDEPLIYIASVVDWFTAGERINIMLAFLTFCSQILLEVPINLIPLGEAGSGKTHVQQTSLKLIPDEFIVHEKNISPAALFRRAEENPYFYEGKIVNYGDLGGDNDQEFMHESKNLMKELQTEGYLNRPITHKVDGEYEIKELELYGNPCLTYTTVPNYVFDDQELSRSLLITPRLDNQVEFNERERILGLHGETYDYLQFMLGKQEDIQDIVYYLKSVYKDILIINPYMELIQKILKNTRYYKRDLNKYNTLLCTIAMFNYKNKTIEKYDDDVNIIYVTRSDVKLFLSLLGEYLVNANENLSPSASRILKELNELSLPLAKEDTTGLPVLDVEKGWTVNEYLKVSALGYAKKSCQLYFKELNEKGYLEVIDTKNRSNVYAIVPSKTIKIEDDLSLSPEMRQTIIRELGEDVLSILDNDEPDPDLSINKQHDSIIKPKWERI